MKDIRIDGDGEYRCWNCGGKGLLAKRTLRSKAMCGVGALLTKKELKCQTCGEYNDTGGAKPYDGPASRKYRKMYDQEQSKKTATQRQAEADTAARLARIEAAEAAEAAAAQPAGPAAPPPPPNARPAAWLADPSGRHELRYYDGTGWTHHVSDAGIQTTDAPD